MRKIRFTLISLTALAAVTLLYSCKKEKNNDKNEAKGDIAVVMNVANPDGDSGAGYIKMVDKMEGQVVEAQNGLPVSYNLRLAKLGDDIFGLPSFFGNGAIKKFHFNNGSLSKTAELQLPDKTGAGCIYIQNAEHAFVNYWSQGIVMEFNPTTMKELRTFDLKPVCKPDDTNPNPGPGAMMERDGKLYVGLNYLTPNMQPSLPGKEVAMAIINLSDGKISLTKAAKDDMYFCTRPIDQGSIIKADNGDIYASCLGLFNMVPGYNSGFVRIKKGSDEFDPSYSWVITENSEKDGHQFSFVEEVLQLNDTEVLAYIFDEKYRVKGDMMGLKSHATRLCRLNLATKTLKVVEGLNPTNSFSLCMDKTTDGKVFVGIEGKGGEIFIYDPDTNTVDKKVVLRTKEIPRQLIDFSK